MATRTVTTRNLVTETAVQFIRPVTLRLTLSAARPNTRLYVFFDGVDLSRNAALAVPSGPTTPIRTDATGNAVIDLSVPGGTFTPGTKQIIITDTNDLANLSTLGSVFGSATASFTSRGRVQVFQESTVRVTTTSLVQTIVVPPPAPPQRQNFGRGGRGGDPLAQSFFTFGVKGGIFVSSIDLFFQTKDDTIPVRVDIRPMANGYPTDPTNIITTNGVQAISIKQPAEVNISANASVPTRFEFDPPVYLEEDRDFCFVVFSSSLNYNVFTSRMGERSIETGRTIFEQPYVGSLFKSENNITWEPSQFEDLKFTINRAEFNTTSEGVIEFAVEVPAVSAQLNQFSTFSGTRTVRYRHNQDHGLEVGNRIGVFFDTSGTYNGIPGASLNGSYTVTAVVDRYTVDFEAGGSTNATSTGAIVSSGRVTSIQIDAEGSGYSPSTTISIGGPGTGATAVPVIEGGRIVAVNVTASGTGYSTAPTITLNNVGAGTGAVVTALVDRPASVRVNKPFQGFIPTMQLRNYSDTRTESTITAVQKNFFGGNIVSYTNGGSYRFKESEDWVDINRNLMVASRENEVTLLGNADSARITSRLISPSSNVSPLLDLQSLPRINVYSRLINAQEGETLTSTNGSGSVASIAVTGAGSNYTIAPIVNITAPNVSGGTQATATATIVGGAITAINVTQAGSGYTRTPIVTISRAPGDTTGTGGAGQAVLTAFNSEVLASGGNALAKYITKRTVLSTISNGVRLFAEISSQPGASVDWYIRTSLSASTTEHETLTWRRLTCDVSRDRSSSDGEFLEYEFRLDGIPSFDTYDLKCVMLAADPTLAPIIKSYRVIVIA